MCPEIPSESEITQAMKLAQTPAGQQLIGLVQENDPAKLREAMENAQTGDFAQIRQMLQKVLATPEAEALVKEIRGSE